MATLDLITTPEAKLALNIPAATTTQDTELAGVITAVSQRIDDLCGPVVKRTVTAEVHDGGSSSIFLRQAPASRTSATTITTVTEYAGTTATVLTADSVGVNGASAYLFDPETGILYRRSGGSDARFPSGRRNVAVTYEAGRYADTAAVAPKFKQACAIAVAHVFRNEQGFSAIDDGTGFSPGRSFSLPNRAMEFIADERRGPAIA